MNNRTKVKRLDDLERGLTPKQWAMRLADDMRRYSSQEDFLKTIAKSTYRKSPFILPYYALAQQAKERYPDNIPASIRSRYELDCKLQEIFQTHKMLIIDINRVIEVMTATFRQKVALLLFKRRTLILQDSLAHTEAAETMSASSMNPGRLRFASLLEIWADDAAMLLTETSAYSAAVQIVQDKYFERHPIIFKDNEMAFETTLQTVRDAITVFNEYIATRAALSNRKSDHEQQNDGMTNAMAFEQASSQPINIERIEKRAKMSAEFVVKNWTTKATFRGTAAIFGEHGRYEDFVWQHFRQEMGLES
jgi:hypothetical protein